MTNLTGDPTLVEIETRPKLISSHHLIVPINCELDPISTFVS